MTLIVGFGPSASAVAEPNLLVLSVETRQSLNVATLRCDPLGGSHPNAAGACAALAAVGGDLNKLTAQPGTVCPDIVDPVTVRARGEYRGTPVTFSRTYPNRCQLDRQAGPIFQL